MISFIVCSVRKDLLDGLTANLQATAGVEHELLVHHNREAGWGLARVYNTLASRARHPLLCFLHEDVRFLSPPGWAREIQAFFQAHPEAGVVGFAGSQVKSRQPSGWSSLPAFDRQHLRQHGAGGRVVDLAHNPGGQPYSPVVVVDGLCLFVPRTAWEVNRFDEATFPGFHLYDLDFSTQVAQTRSNFVCHTVLAEHFSAGSFGEAWRDAAEAYHRKWAERLPLACVPLDARQRDRCEAHGAYRWLRNLLRQPAPDPARLRRAWAGYRALARPGYDLRLVRYRLRAAWRWLRARPG